MVRLTETFIKSNCNRSRDLDVMTPILSSAKKHIFNAESFSSPIIIIIYVIVSVDILAHPTTDDNNNLYHLIISKCAGAPATPSPRANKVKVSSRIKVTYDG